LKSQARAWPVVGNSSIILGKMTIIRFKQQGRFAMKTIIYAYGAAIIAAALATPSMSQVAGTYAGTSADGNAVSFVVGTDTNNGELAVTTANISFSAPCKNSTYELNTGWSFGLLADINKARKVFISENGNYFRFKISLDFDSDGQSATGTILSTSPTLYPVGPNPARALICTAAMQALSLTLQSSSDAAQQEFAIKGKTQINLISPRASDDSSVEASH
jgi:hypothetical protein